MCVSPHRHVYFIGLPDNRSNLQTHTLTHFGNIYCSEVLHAILVATTETSKLRSLDGPTPPAVITATNSIHSGDWIFRCLFAMIAAFIRGFQTAQATYIRGGAHSLTWSGYGDGMDGEGGLR